MLNATQDKTLHVCIYPSTHPSSFVFVFCFSFYGTYSLYILGLHIYLYNFYFSLSMIELDAGRI